MVKIKVINIKGKETEKLELNPLIFDGKVNHALLHQAIVSFLANQRKGLASTKTRGEVRGGGAKPWRQKGTGRARVGSNRSPLWRKGGVTFDPHPHSFHKELPKRMKALALKSALNAKHNDKELLVLDQLRVKSHKTKEFVMLMKQLKIEGQRVRFVIGAWDENSKLSSRNMQNVTMERAQELTAYEVLNCNKIVFTKDALTHTQERVKKWVH